jgi:hypothetical protein
MEKRLQVGGKMEQEAVECNSNSGMYRAVYLEKAKAKTPLDSF